MATPTSIKLDDTLKNRVQNLANSQQRTAHWIMKEAISQYVEREEKKEAFRQDALNAWDEYQMTGSHLTASEVENWLGSWGSEDEVEAPKCHK
ncbi:TPA: CopG family ribbon-helix-helix protein [Vibrio parahaemolyticus]|jgi:predicted transcriptional regulator|uniref:CopG family ribbon-helix-helix protein n=1 Tax=Vibrio harveyi group TaxID=717610 RepID=UPI00223F6036|nr:CopG family ribbon-helix-helix protein [Vibrio parahaemolyticus]HCH1049336.1 CopG family ribbon-helix-helix protein [Vibrio parahaemolyticus]HCH6297862.1 CopG family ribbon-helix-helix protein [Vibrio parahaemolyticus]HCK0613651.1 CopG family ribbon-helix-helix protein [Vibrio parahaemolyticus]